MFYLPHEENSIDNFARALWLETRQAEILKTGVANGIGTAFKGVK